MTNVTPGIADLERQLLAGRNPDGGWGYYREKASRLEPTCWAALALRYARSRVDAGSALARWPSQGGLLLERAGAPPNFGFHGVALLALRALGVDHAAGTASLVAALQRVAGIPLKPSTVNRQDNSLQAWSWIEGTFSWVEPTAWCLLALKKWNGSGVAIDPNRVSTAERLLIDRACDGGGWNYGNSNMLGQTLKAYVPTTAVALLSLRDRRSEAVVAKGHEYLRTHATAERSGLSLALSLLCLMTYDSDATGVRTALSNQIGTTMALGNQLAMALSLFALSVEPHDAAVVV